tara:strand:- start:328 stop:519 length:192 start_codon:yes stop_codon:yes gene_type:complete
MAGNRYKRMPRYMGKDPELKMYLDQLSAEIEKGFLEVDRVTGEDDTTTHDEALRYLLSGTVSA